MMRSATVAILAATLIVAVLLPTASPAASGTTIVGRIVSVQGGLPVQNAKVELEQGSTVIATSTTAADGSFSFPNEKPGIYNVRISAAGYQAAVSDDIVVFGNESQVSAQMAIQPFEQGMRTIATERVSTHASLQTSATINNHIDASILQSENYMRAGEAIATLPFANGSTSSSLGDDYSISIRGYDPSETATLLDGHPIGPIGAFSGGYDMQMSPFWGISGTDVVYGSGATGLYGVSTIAGAIDFNTLNPTREAHSTVEQGIGNDGRMMTGLSATGSFNKLGYALAYGAQGTDGEFVGNPTQWGLLTDPSNCNPNSPDAGYPSIRQQDVLACSYNVDGNYILHDAEAKLTYDLTPTTNLLVSTFNQSFSADSQGNGDMDYVTQQELNFVNLPQPNPVSTALPNGATATCSSGYVVLNDSARGYECMSAAQFDKTFSGPAGGGLDRYHDGHNQDYHARVTQQLGKTSFILDGYVDTYNFNNVKGPYPSHHYQDLYETHGLLASDEYTAGKNDLSAGVFIEHQQHTGFDIGAGTVEPDLQMSANNYFLRDTYSPNGKFTTFLDMAVEHFREDDNTSLNPRLSFMFRPTSNDVFRITGGHSTSIPDPSLLYGNISFGDVNSFNPQPIGNGLISIASGNNAALKPESANDFEVAYGHRFTSQTILQVNAYDSNETNPLVNGVFPLSTLPASEIPDLTAYANKEARYAPGMTIAQIEQQFGVSETFNAGSAAYRGIDVEASVGLARNLTLNGYWVTQSAAFNGMPAYILQNNTSLINGAQIYGIPLHRTSLGLGYDNPSGFAMRMDGYYIDGTNGLNRAPYVYANMSISKTFNPQGVTINLGIYNVFNNAAQLYGFVGLGAVQPQNQYGDPAATALSEGSEEYGLPFRQFMLTFSHKV
ncbi:MAG TPA: TonB-dependent receptor [Candidatus Baltobacteraceae bacterium]|nr:TonB-dependent receptor [Candidatus Baltobacteraceae bacterium]